MQRSVPVAMNCKFRLFEVRIALPVSNVTRVFRHMKPFKTMCRRCRSRSMQVVLAPSLHTFLFVVSSLVPYLSLSLSFLVSHFSSLLASVTFCQSLVHYFASLSLSLGSFCSSSLILSGFTRYTVFLSIAPLYAKVWWNPEHDAHPLPDTAV